MSLREAITAFFYLWESTLRRFSRTNDDGSTFKTRNESLRFIILTIGIVISMFMMSLNSTVIAPALSIIVTELNGLESQTWIASAYLVALNAFQPLSGRFSDIFGRQHDINFFTGFVACLLLALNWDAQYGWSSGHSLDLFVSASVFLTVLIYVESWVAKEPLLPARVLFNPACPIVYCYMLHLVLPLLVHSVFGANNTESDVRLIPFILCLIGGSIGGGVLIRKHPNAKIYIVVNAAANLLAGYLSICGLAFSHSQQNAILIAQISAEIRDIAVATSTTSFSLTLACSVGIAAYQILYSVFLQGEFAKLPADVLAQASKSGALANYLYIRQLPLDIQGPVIHAYSDALNTVFIFPIATAALGFILSLFFKNVKYGVPAAVIV